MNHATILEQSHCVILLLLFFYKTMEDFQCLSRKLRTARTNCSATTEAWEE
jgi:hypothetical protein